MKKSGKQKVSREKTRETLKEKNKLQNNPTIQFSQLAEQIWPQERDVFFRPGRMKYVRKLIKPQGCVFCVAAEQKKSIKTLCVFKTKFSQVVVNKFPYNNGHLLVLPLRHCGNLLELTEDEYFDLQNVIRICFEALKTIYNPQGFNLGLNHGAAGGAGIPDHIHYHIVPRWYGDLNFFPLIAETKLVIEEAETTYQKLIKYFKNRKDVL